MSVTNTSFVENSFKDYSAFVNHENPYLNGDKISRKFLENVQVFRNKKLTLLTTEMKNEIFCMCCYGTVYTGSAGLALYYYTCGSTRKDDIDLLQRACTYLNLKSLKGKRISFLCGDAGPLALGAVISYKLKSQRPEKLPDYKVLISKLLSLITLLPDVPDELLYGKSGYLYALLFVKAHIPKENVIPSNHIEKVVNAIISSGKAFSNQTKSDSSLLWEWHDKTYLGGAHGVAGILYLLLQAKEFMSETDLLKYVFPTLLWLMKLRFQSGNFPSSLGSSSGDRLVQWCHGAPGFVPLYLLAHEIFKDEVFMKIARDCGEVVWQRGICSKGYSICHGVSGNAYTFIQLYQATKEPVYLHRACCFMEWCMQERAGTERHHPDRPASLFEGLAGRLFLTEDLSNIHRAKFPAYTL